MRGILSGVGFLLMGGGLAALFVKDAVVSGNPASTFTFSVTAASDLR